MPEQIWRFIHGKGESTSREEKVPRSLQKVEGKMSWGQRCALGKQGMEVKISEVEQF